MSSTSVLQPVAVNSSEEKGAEHAHIGTHAKTSSLRGELWILLAIFAIAFLMNSALSGDHMMLGLYTLPTIFSAYFYGRRHAVLTAIASICLVLMLAYINPRVLPNQFQLTITEQWAEVGLWAGILIVTAYAMGTLYERSQAKMREVRRSYEGILHILQHIASNNKYSQNHPFRVSITATKIAEQLDLGRLRVEDVRAAGLLHEVDQLGISREMLYAAANLEEHELRQMQEDLQQGKELAPTQDAGLSRIIQILLAYHAAMDKAKESKALPNAPLESRILLVADVYDTLTSATDKRISPSEAMQRIVQRSGIEYDPEVVDAMVKVFRRRGATAPNAVPAPPAPAHP